MCRQDEPASCLYVLISGRVRLIREYPGMRPRVRVEEEVGRGEAVGAVWALTGGIHDTTALCVRDSELVRMSKVGPHLPGCGKPSMCSAHKSAITTAFVYATHNSLQSLCYCLGANCYAVVMRQQLRTHSTFKHVGVK